MTSIASLIVTAVLSAVAVWMKLIEKQIPAIVRLLVLVLCLTGASMLLTGLGKLFEDRERRIRFSHEWNAQVERTLREYSDQRLPHLSELDDVAFGVTSTRYTRSGTAPYVPRPEIDKLLRSALAVDRAPFPYVVLVGRCRRMRRRT